MSSKAQGPAGHASFRVSGRIGAATIFLALAAMSGGCPRVASSTAAGEATLVGTWKAVTSVFRGRLRRYSEQELDLYFTFKPDGRWVTFIHLRGKRGMRKLGRWQRKGAILTTKRLGLVSSFRYRLAGNQLTLEPVSGNHAAGTGRSVFVRVR